VFLAALMIMSVFAVPLAFTGVAAASVDDSDLSDEAATDVKAGASADYQEVTFNITDLDSSESDDLELDFENVTDADGELLGASATSNNTNVSVSADVNDNVVTVSVENVGDDPENVTVTVGVVHDLSDVEPVLDVSVPITNESGDGDNVGTMQFNVSGVDVDTSNRAYEGQFIQYVNDSINGNAVELIRDYDDDGDNEFIDVEEVTDDIVYFDTTGLETGDSYTLINTDDDNNELGTVQLTQNRYSAEWTDSQVEDAGDTTVDAEIDANRGTYTIYVTADELDGEEIFDLFNNTDTQDNIAETDDGVVLYDIRDGDYGADFEGVDTGDYTFEFDMVDTIATDESTITVTDGDDDDLVFVESNVDVAQGDIAEIEIEDVGGVDSGYLVIGGMDDAGYEAVIEITDIEDDTFTIEFNTYLAGNASENIVSSEGADVEVVNFDSDNQDGIAGILDVGDYDLSLGTASIETPSDEDDVQEFIDNADEVGALFIEDRTVGGMTLWTASSSNAEDLDDADDIADAIENGLLTETDGIAFDDALVHQIEIDGLGGFFEGTEEDDLDEALLQLVSGDGEDVDGNALEAVLALNIEQTDDSRQSNRQAAKLNTSELTADDIGVIYEGGELFVTIESLNNDLDWTDSNGGDRTVRDGDVFTAELEILDQRLLEEGDSQDPYTALDEDDEDDSLTVGSDEFSVADREGEFINLNDDDEIEVEADEDQEITASTNVAPGTEFSIRTSGDGNARFVKTQRDLVVTTDGDIVGMFDFSDRAVDEEFTAQLRGGSLADDRPEADGIIVEPAVEEPADDDEESADDEEEPADDDEESADDEEEPADDDEESADDEDESVDDEDESVDDEDESVDDEDESVDETDDETPGFGALVALVALLGATLLAARRQD